MNDKPKYLELSVTELSLCLSNFRFLNPVKNEQEAILEMLRLKKVGPTKIKNLITDLVERKIIFEDFIVLEEDGKYIVYDGNRRLTAIKLFLEENLSLIKEEFKNLYNYITNLKKDNIDLSNMIVSAKLYDNKDIMLEHIKKIHSGEQGGVGQISWGNLEKGNFNKLYANNKPTFSNKLLPKLKSNPKYKSLYNKIVDNQIATTIDRIFGFYGIKSRIFGLKRGEDISIENEENLKKICEMIDYFINKNGSVSDVYLKDDAESFFKTIKPVSHNKNNIQQLSFDDISDIKKKSSQFSIRKNNVYKETSEKDNPVTQNTFNEINNSLKSDSKTNITNNTKIEQKMEKPDNNNKVNRIPNPESTKYLTSAYKLKNQYKENPRINKIKRELGSLEYKEFTISAMFLIRALLETYTHEYIDYFANLPNHNQLKMKNIAKDRTKRNKSLQEYLYSDIYNHLKNVLEKYPETYELINTTLSNNNNTALTQIINHHIHSGINFPDEKEVLNAWSKAFIIINTLDEVLYDYKTSGQTI